MNEKGYLDGTKMATAFNMLRSGDLIWPYVVNNYMRGKEPLPFDLLYWNADSTRMAAANHSFYLRNCYLENNLVAGQDGAGGPHGSTSRTSRSRSTISPRGRTISRLRSRCSSARSISAATVELRDGRLRPYRRRRQPAGISKYQYWTGGAGRRLRPWIAKAHRTSGILVAALATLDRGQGQRPACRPQTRQAYENPGDAPGTYVKVRV